MRNFRAYTPYVGVSYWDEYGNLVFEDMRWRTLDEIDKEIIPEIGNLTVYYPGLECDVTVRDIKKNVLFHGVIR